MLITVQEERFKVMRRKQSPGDSRLFSGPARLSALRDMGCSQFSEASRNRPPNLIVMHTSTMHSANFQLFKK